MSLKERVNHKFADTRPAKARKEARGKGIGSAYGFVKTTPEEDAKKWNKPYECWRVAIDADLSKISAEWWQDKRTELGKDGLVVKFKKCGTSIAKVDP